MNNTETQLEYIRLYKEMDSLYRILAYKQKLSVSEFDIFYAVSMLGNGCFQKDICHLSLISKQTVNSAIKKMEQSGLLELVSDEGRKKQICLTDSGKEVLKTKMQPIVDAEINSFSEMTESERDLLISLTKKFISLMKKNTETIYKMEV